MSIFSRTQGIGMAAILLAMSTIISRCMGIVREKIISWQFGAGAEVDIYFAAFVVPDIINYLLAGGFMAITLLPILSRLFASDEEDGWRFFSAVLTWMAVAAVLFTAAALFFVEPLAKLAAPGLAPEMYGRLQLFMHLTMPAQLFFLTGSCFTALLYMRRQFVIPALSPLIYNGTVITMGALLPVLGLVRGMSGYCAGVLVGAGLGILMLPVIAVRQGGLHYRPCFWHPQLKRFILLALPLMLGQTISALDEQFLRIFSSLTGEGSVALISYARRIAAVPAAVIGQVAGMASYPFLVALLTRGDKENFVRVLSLSLRTGLCLAIPLIMWMSCVTPSTFTLLFYGGRMTEAEIVRAVPLLQTLLVATPVWVLLELITRSFYAQSDTLTPALWGTIITIVFLPVYRFIAVPMGPQGVAVCSPVSLAAFTAVLVVIWIRRQGAFVFSGLLSSLVKAVLCAVPGCVGGWWLDEQVTRLMDDFSPILTSFFALSAAGLFFVGTFVPLGIRFMPEIFDRITSRLRKRMVRTDTSAGNA